MSEALICEKALDIYGVLVKITLGTNSKDLHQKPSRGWFELKKKWNSLFT